MTLIVSPLRHVPDLVATRKPSHVLTLLAPEIAPPLCPGVPAARHLKLTFNDVIAPLTGFIAPDPLIVQAILEFGDAWDGTRPMLVHCSAGISRSTAAAYIIACERMGTGSEEACAVRLRSAAPSATPNSLMVAIADEVLERGGRMVAAIAAIGRGADAFEGTPFDFRVAP
jgi:predicted protein tyrosine phosphatase